MNTRYSLAAQAAIDILKLWQNTGGALQQTQILGERLEAQDGMR